LGVSGDLSKNHLFFSEKSLVRVLFYDHQTKLSSFHDLTFLIDIDQDFIICLDGRTTVTPPRGREAVSWLCLRNSKKFSDFHVSDTFD